MEHGFNKITDETSYRAAIGRSSIDGRRRETTEIFPKLLGKEEILSEVGGRSQQQQMRLQKHGWFKDRLGGLERVDRQRLRGRLRYHYF